MVIFCCVPTCQVRREKKVSLHRFPPEDDTNRYEIWISRIGRPDLLMRARDVVRKSFRVCAHHFSDEQKIPVFCRNRTTIVKTAVPDINLPYNQCTFLPPSVLRDHNYTSVVLYEGAKMHRKPVKPASNAEDISLTGGLGDDFLNFRSTHICLFCMKVLEEINEVNIQMTVTGEGRIVEDFLRATLLQIGTEKVLESYYMCTDCSDLVNKFEEYFSKCNAIQDSLTKQYVEHRKLKDHKSNTENDVNILYEKMQDISVICDNKEFSTKSTQTCEDNQFEYPGNASMLECFNTPDELPIEVDRFDDDDFRWENNENVEPEPRKEENNGNIEPEPENERFYCGNVPIINPVMIRRLKKEKNKLQTEKQKAKKIKPPPPDSSNGYICHKCGKIYWRYDQFKKHEHNHKNEGRFRCEVCSKIFSFKTNFDNHIVTHTDFRPHKCEECEKAFRSPWALNKHKLAKHPSEADSNRFCCDKCGQVYTSYYGFKLHIRKHKEENKHYCEICDKTFTQASGLKLHNTIHLGIRPFKCEICGKAFRIKQKLNTHLEWHEGIRKHQCEECGKAFVMKQQLKKHKNIHLVIKPFPCSLCGRRFAHRANMSAHKKIHFKGKNKHLLDL